MIVLKCNQFIQGAYSIREMFIQLCNKELIKLKKHNNLALLQILDIFDLDEIKQSFKDISVDIYGNLIIPEHTKSSRILRYLEFGGENAKPTHLLTNVSNEINRLFKIERR